MAKLNELMNYMYGKEFFKNDSIKALFLLGYVTRGIMENMTADEKVDYSKDKLISLNYAKFNKKHIYKVLIPDLTLQIEEKKLNREYGEIMNMITGIIANTDLAEIDTNEAPYSLYFFTGYSFSDRNLYNVITFSEAAKLWGIDDSTLRKLPGTGRLQLGVDYRKSGSTWLITRDAMYKLYGEPKRRE